MENKPNGASEKQGSFFSSVCSCFSNRNKTGQKDKIPGPAPKVLSVHRQNPDYDAANIKGVYLRI